MGANWRIVLYGSMLAMMMTVSFYFVTVYTPTSGTGSSTSIPGRHACHLLRGDPQSRVAAQQWSAVRRIGRRPILITTTVLTLVTAYPVLSWLVAAPSFGRLMAAELWLSAVYAFFNGAFIVYLTEIMPASVRTAGFSWHTLSPWPLRHIHSCDRHVPYS